MASIMIRNLDEDVKLRLKVRAAQNNRSMEEEVRIILRDSVRANQERALSLVDIARDAVEPYGGFEMELPQRDNIRPAF
jgi:plasmid stability protein